VVMNGGIFIFDIKIPFKHPKMAPRINIINTPKRGSVPVLIN